MFLESVTVPVGKISQAWGSREGREVGGKWLLGLRKRQEDARPSVAPTHQEAHGGLLRTPSQLVWEEPQHQKYQGRSPTVKGAEKEQAGSRGHSRQTGQLSPRPCCVASGRWPTSLSPPNPRSGVGLWFRCSVVSASL